MNIHEILRVVTKTNQLHFVNDPYPESRIQNHFFKLWDKAFKRLWSSALRSYINVCIISGGSRGGGRSPPIDLTNFCITVKSNPIMHQNPPFSGKNSIFFLGRGHSPLDPRLLPSTVRPLPPLWNSGSATVYYYYYFSILRPIPMLDLGSRLLSILWLWHRCAQCALISALLVSLKWWWLTKRNFKVV